MDTKRCDNLACVCEVPLATPTCSPYCDSLDARATDTIKCECGHPTCAHEMEAELSGQTA